MIPNEIRKALLIIFALLLVVIPVFFVWHTELIFPVTTAAAGNISSGYVSLNGSGAHKLYHNLMYATFGSAFVAAFYILYSNLEIKND